MSIPPMNPNYPSGTGNQQPNLPQQPYYQNPYSAQGQPPYAPGQLGYPPPPGQPGYPQVTGQPGYPPATCQPGYPPSFTQQSYPGMYQNQPGTAYLNPNAQCAVYPGGNLYPSQSQQRCPNAYAPVFAPANVGPSAGFVLGPKPSKHNKAAYKQWKLQKKMLQKSCDHKSKKHKKKHDRKSSSSSSSSSSDSD